MRKWIYRIIPIGVLGFLLFLLCAMLFRFTNKSALCNVPLASYPDKVTLSTIMEGNWQADFGKWLNDNFYGHTKIVKCYNQLAYSIFHDGTGNLLVGRNGWIVEKNQTQAFTSLGYTNPTSEEVWDSYAKKIAVLQTQLQQSGKDFVYLITPSKVEMYPEYFPWHEKLIYKRYAADYSPANKLIAAFQKYGVHYYDTTKDIKEMIKENQFPVWYNTGHHWTVTAVANEIQPFFSYMRQIAPDIDYPNLSVTGFSDQMWPSDQDLLQDANIVFGRMSNEKYVTPIIKYDKTSANSIYLMGTSYGYQLTGALWQSGTDKAFKKMIWQQYFVNTTTLDSTGNHVDYYTPDNVPSDLKIMPNLQGTDLVIMEQQGILGVVAENERFADYVNQNIGRIFYNPGENAMTYTKDQAGISYENFYDQEDWGRWSLGNTGTVHVYGNKLAQIGTDLTLRLNADSYGIDKRAEILFNGTAIGTIVLAGARPNRQLQDYTISIPAGLVNETVNTIEFRLDGEELSPKDLGLSDDARNLGIGIANLSIEGGDAK